MEATAAVSTAPGSSLNVPPSSRKEWRAVAEHHSTRNLEDEDLEQTKQGQSDERTIYEQQIHDIARQREEVQLMEIELRAQLIARNEIMEMQNNFDAQLKEHANSASKLQEQLHEREHKLHELEK